MATPGEFICVCGTSSADVPEECMARAVPMAVALGDIMPCAKTASVARADLAPASGRREPDDRLSLLLFSCGSFMWLVLRLFTSERRDFGVGRVLVDALTSSDVEAMAGSAIPGKSSEFAGGDVAVSEGHGARSALLLAMSLLGNTPLYMSVAVSAQEDCMSFETLVLASTT